MPCYDQISAIALPLNLEETLILNAGTDGPFTRAACLINRFIVAELIKLGVVTYRPGRLDMTAIKQEGARFAVTLDGSECRVDLVVVRHGPEVRPLARFPAIDSALTPVRSFLRTYRAGVDRTRARAWGPLSVIPAAGPGVLPPPSGDVLEYLGRSMQKAFKDELARREIRAMVGYECHAQSLDLRVRIGPREEKITVALVSGTHVTLTQLRSTGGPRAISVTLTADVMQDAGSAVPVLAARVPELVNLVVEE